jgi:hypothetical protein
VCFDFSVTGKSKCACRDCSSVRLCCRMPLLAYPRFAFCSWLEATKFLQDIAAALGGALFWRGHLPPWEAEAPKGLARVLLPAQWPDGRERQPITALSARWLARLLRFYLPTLPRMPSLARALVLILASVPAEMSHFLGDFDSRGAA